MLSHASAVRGAAAILLGMLCLPIPATAEGQAPATLAYDTDRQGAVPDASFDVSFRKYTPPKNVFSPYYAWDATMELRLTAFRRGASAVNFRGVVQTVGTENFGSSVSVGGTGYLLTLSYAHTYSANVALSAGVAHLSSHLTRDLDKKMDEERSKGHPIPTVDDPSEYNAVFVRGTWTLSTLPFTPALDVVIQPISFHFHRRDHDDVRPIYLGTRFTLWRGDRKALVAETQHEIGTRPFNNFSLLFELYPRNQPNGCFQVFVNGSPGHAVHVSPAIGGVRDGIAFGVRMRLRT